ncbi:MAG: NUDIX hydrolase [Desulfomonilia bacterium]
MHHGSIGNLIFDETRLKAHIRELLSQRDRRIIPSKDLRESAVLVPLCWEEGEPRIVVTKRSMDVEHHKGEISFPGGRAEDDDPSYVYTALREAEEEIGLNPEDVEVLGLLDDHISIVGFHITPVVGAVPAMYDFRINFEAETLLKVSVPYMLRDSVWMAEEATFMDRNILVYFLEIEGGVVWGATARMLKHFADLIAGHPLEFSPVSQSAREWVAEVISNQAIYRTSKR